MKKFMLTSLSTILVLTVLFSAFALSVTPAAADKPVETKTHNCNGARCPDPTATGVPAKDSPQWGLTPHPGGVNLGATKKAPTATSVVIVQLTNTVVVSQPTFTPLPTNTPKPNQAGKQNCDQLNAAGITPSAPASPMSLEAFALQGAWNWTWKLGQGRSRTWSANACTWTGNHWSAFRMDPSNSHINDSDLSNDNQALLNKLRQPYEDYLSGNFRFVQ